MTILFKWPNNLAKRNMLKWEFQSLLFNLIVVFAIILGVEIISENSSDL